MIVKVEVVFQRWKQFEAGGEVAGINQFVLERAPQAFDENVVECATAAIHADRDAAWLDRRQKIRRSELCEPRIGVPDLKQWCWKAARSAARRKPVSMVLESSQLSTKRLNQSITATRYRKPPRIGM